MSACTCCPPAAGTSPERSARRPAYMRTGLFNWVTLLLLTGWVGIVSVAAQLAGPEKLAAAPMPTFEMFLQTLF